MKSVIFLCVFFIFITSSSVHSAASIRPSGVIGSCGDDKYGSVGAVASPNFPHGHYPPDTTCNYTVTVDQGQVIKFKFSYMDLEEGPIQRLGSCSADYLIITELNSVEASMVGGQRFCGGSTIFNPVYTTTNKAYIWFKSDETIDKQGFVLKWTTVEPPEKQFDCDFETMQGLCNGWKQLETNRKGMWKTNHGLTWSSRKRWVTGPFYDHTKRTALGSYVYVEATGLLRGSVVGMISPPVDVTKNERYCLSFWYHMFGSGIGSLTVYEVQEGKEDQPRRGNIMFKKIGEQARKWMEAVITINRRAKPLSFIFEVERGLNYRGDIAIDDIIMQDKGCDEIK